MYFLNEESMQETKHRSWGLVGMKISPFPPRSKWWGDVSILDTVKDFGHLWYNKPRGYLPPTLLMYYGKNVAISRGWGR